jgi:3'-phosphoadenosine 5'-phosphosulfate sulfotransferase (PAPS reductase)/FAD synthetase
LKLTAEELHERQKWTLAQKIDHSLGAIEQFNDYTRGKMVVMFSGGKDSTVLLHLTRFLYPNIKAVFVNTTNELSEILQFVRTVENVDTILPKITFIKTVEKYGFPLISKKVAKAINYLKYPSDKTANVRNLVLTGFNSKGESCVSYKLAKKWYFLKDEPFDITNKCCDLLKHKPFKEYQKTHDVFPLTGIMADNSQQRKGNYLRYGCNIMNGKSSIGRPLSIWNDEDIWNYIKQNNVPYCNVYDMGEKNTGCAYCGFGCHLEKESRF